MLRRVIFNTMRPNKFNKLKFSNIFIKKFSDKYSLNLRKITPITNNNPRYILENNKFNNKNIISNNVITVPYINKFNYCVKSTDTLVKKKSISAYCLEIEQYAETIIKNNTNNTIIKYLCYVTFDTIVTFAFVLTTTLSLIFILENVKELIPMIFDIGIKFLKIFVEYTISLSILYLSASLEMLIMFLHTTDDLKTNLKIGNEEVNILERIDMVNN